MIHLTIPGKPFGKQRHQTSIRGKGEKAYLHEWTPTATVNYEAIVRLAFMERYPKHVPYERNVALVSQIEAFYLPPMSFNARQRENALSGIGFERPRVNDLDNCTKIVWDALNQVAFADDSQIAKALAEKYYSDRPRMEFKLWTLEEYQTLQDL